MLSSEEGQQALFVACGFFQIVFNYFALQSMVESICSRDYLEFGTAALWKREIDEAVRAPKTGNYADPRERSRMCLALRSSV